MSEPRQVIATPTPGTRVRKPNGEILLSSGEAVERTSYWLRRKIDGDVNLAPLPIASDQTEALAEAPKKAKA